MILFIAILITLIVFGALNGSVDNEVLYPILIGLVLFFTLLMVYIKMRQKK